MDCFHKQLNWIGTTKEIICLSSLYCQFNCAYRDFFYYFILLPGVILLLQISSPHFDSSEGQTIINSWFVLFWSRSLIFSTSFGKLKSHVLFVRVHRARLSTLGNNSTLKNLITSNHSIYHVTKDQMIYTWFKHLKEKLFFGCMD